MPNAVYPDAQTCAELANNFFAGQKSLHSDKGWSLLTEDEKNNAIVAWRMSEAEKRTEGNNGASQSLYARLFTATKGLIERNHQALIARLPELLERDLSQIVKRALDSEMHFIWQRQSEQAMRQAERLDNVCAQMAQIKSSDGKSRMQAMDLYLSELQSEMRRLGEEVAELKGRLSR